MLNHLWQIDSVCGVGVAADAGAKEESGAGAVCGAAGGVGEIHRAVYRASGARKSGSLAAAPAMKREAQPSVDWMPELLLLVWAAGFVAIGMKWGRRWTQMNSDGGRLASGKLRPSS